MKNKVREYRKQNKMTQQELADAVHVSSRTIISLEQGKYNPSIMLAYKIALLFGTTIEEIYCLEENKKLEDDSSED
ncbi:transcriptional regulator [Romboutsia maritimum]|uniref:Transcriptional regulator n=1 Tax=Romboutsia maritimum TaxID=2020948 RepID=A0A371IUZ5_9FIRM|nr:helix-turn-helix transcriptional regulator [Romboutsia maritimum]RDY24296.1 transcriptional regulator [Romboutsia maritimum]